MKRIIAAAVLTFLAVVNHQSASAAECWTRSSNETVQLPPGVALQPDGYICADHRGVYAQVKGDEPREVVIPYKGVSRVEWVRPRTQLRPLSRIGELLDAGLAYPAQDDDIKLTKETHVEQHHTADRRGL